MASDIQDHVEKCCVVHGCKWCDPDCPVIHGGRLQEGLCDLCEDEEWMGLVLTSICRAGGRITLPKKGEDFYRLHVAEEIYPMKCLGTCAWELEAEDGVRLYQQLMAWKIIKPEEHEDEEESSQGAG